MYGFASRLSNEIVRRERANHHGSERPWNRNGVIRPRSPEEPPALAEIKRISGPDWTFGLSPDIPRTSGATVDTGLGPTNGLNAFCEKR